VLAPVQRGSAPAPATVQQFCHPELGPDALGATDLLIAKGPRAPTKTPSYALGAAHACTERRGAAPATAGQPPMRPLSRAVFEAGPEAPWNEPRRSSPRLDQPRGPAQLHSR
jgi:hypothetical protein